MLGDEGAVPGGRFKPAAAAEEATVLTVLLAKVSVPESVARVPVAGRVTLVPAAEFRVVAPPTVVSVPAVLMLPPSVMVLAPLFTPEPP